MKNKIELNGKTYGIYMDFETYEAYGEKMGFVDFDEIMESLTSLYVKNKKTGKDTLAIGALKKLSCFIFCGIEVYADHQNQKIEITEKTVKRMISENFEEIIPKITELLVESFATEKEIGNESETKKKNLKVIN